MVGDGSAEQLPALADHRQVRVRVSVASDPRVGPRLLAKLAADPSRSVRRVVAARTDTPPEVLRGLVRDGDRQTREALATNPNCSVETLIELLADQHWAVRWSVLDNPAANAAVDRAACASPDQALRAILARRPGLADEIAALLARDASAEVRAAVAESTDSAAALAALLADPDPRVRAAAGMNGRTTVEQRRRLVHDAAWQVRNSVVWSKATFGWQIPEGDLLLLARDRSVNVRFWLANLPGATRRVYEILADDPDGMVADAAEPWLLPADSPQHPDNVGVGFDPAWFPGELVRPAHSWGAEYLGEPIPQFVAAQPPPPGPPAGGDERSSP